MRWLTFLICAAVVLTLQAAVAPRLELMGIRPDWVLVVVVFFALHARVPDSILGAWMIGFCADLLTIERFGLLSVSYGLTAVFIVSIRDYVFITSTVTQAVVTLVAGLRLRTAWMVYRRNLYDVPETIAFDLVTQVCLASLYTVAWAPLIQRPLLHMSRRLGLVPPRYGR